MITVNRTIRINLLNAITKHKCTGRYMLQGQMNKFVWLIYSFDGKVKVYDGIKNIILESGDVTIIPQELGQYMESVDNSGEKVLIIGCDATGFDMEATLGKCITPNISSVHYLNEIISCLHMYDKECEDYLNIADKLILHTIANLLEIFILSLSGSVTQGSIVSTRGVMEFKRITDIMRDNIFDNLSIKALASKCEMSESNLKKIFSKYSALSIHKYFLKMKIYKAIELLGENYNVAEISEMLSFNNQNYFGVVFKKETGYSPLNYRKKFLS